MKTPMVVARDDGQHSTMTVDVQNVASMELDDHVYVGYGEVATNGKGIVFIIHGTANPEYEFLTFHDRPERARIHAEHCYQSYHA